MEIAYLCAARKSDVLKITRQDLMQEGIYIRQGKTGKKQIKRWTPRLHAAVALAEKQLSEIASLFLLHDGTWDAVVPKCGGERLATRQTPCRGKPWAQNRLHIS
ncbi:MAG: hypothetical protein ACREXS_07375 [Gammaproteobacteria bacterium]